VEEIGKHEEIIDHVDTEKKAKDPVVVNEMEEFEENEDLIRDWLEESV